MAQFKYLGEVPRSFVASYGPTKKIAVPQKNGGRTVLDNSDGWPVGEVLPYDFEDQISLMFLRADPRFEEVTG
jgi:hypothetical protein